MVSITIYVEGGGHSSLNTKCRQGFSEFFKKLGIKPKIVACGGRSNALKDFRIALKTNKPNEYCLLLIDSEAQVNNTVWQHLFELEQWQKPENAKDEQLHFMAQCMETWFMADKQTLGSYYGQHFNKNALPQNSNIENISKQDLFNSLKNATRDTKKGEYSKGGHSFDILSQIDANKVIVNSIYAKRLYDELQQLISN